MKLLRNIGAGALAGAAGTLGMDLLQYARYRSADGKDGLWRWEFAGGVMSWDQASAPGQLARKGLHEITGEDPPDQWARPATNIMHWATGAGWGVAYGALASVTSRYPWARTFALGPVAWLSGYVVLPLVKVYKPIWEYDAKTLSTDLFGHLVYGASTSVAFRALSREMS
jgi:hypothetical protein